jgi:hypothetical protein
VDDGGGDFEKGEDDDEGDDGWDDPGEERMFNGRGFEEWLEEMAEWMCENGAEDNPDEGERSANGSLSPAH